MRLRSLLLSLIAVVIVLALVTGVCAEEPSKPLRAGIIGTTTSHVPAFTKTINKPDAEGPLADVEVVAGFTGGIEDNPSSWGRREKYTQFLRENG